MIGTRLVNKTYSTNFGLRPRIRAKLGSRMTNSAPSGGLQVRATLTRLGSKSRPAPLRGTLRDS
ncbi:hypothetical protein [Pseudobacteriovorax antillogorgiicola]|uniref:Uncharacterized protein n=1 Tax=Pseudobacteriovorax antillogorgiicola TaxID=1513793 RepID=A0A1Y6CUG2_9BACT|nr:hypothetical protein [Pseudobacteriovorax antillogorgiicola]TCS44571.1 hypothetical protein EDD56_1324 [Pseudobacteriovorax antillogorgiicola]SMF77919.1 hypothetical protein SAMN06296036_1324 [Pseudobacteriovorax antillogorgiicola]